MFALNVITKKEPVKEPKPQKKQKNLKNLKHYSISPDRKIERLIKENIHMNNSPDRPYRKEKDLTVKSKSSRSSPKKTSEGSIERKQTPFFN